MRGALAVLVEVGFLARYEPEAGKRYQRTEGGLRRRAVLHRFGEDYGVEFGRANARAQAARGAAPPARRPIARPEPLPAVLGHVVNRTPLSEKREVRPLPQLAQKQAIGGSRVIMGEENRAAPDSPLEAALARWARAIGE